MTELEKYERLLAQAEADSKKACESKGRLPLGASRAKRTTLEARWARAAEYRDRLLRIVEEMRERPGAGRAFIGNEHGLTVNAKDAAGLKGEE